MIDIHVRCHRHTEKKPVCVSMFVPAHCSSLAMMMAVRAASLYCCRAIYRRNRYLASWEEEIATDRVTRGQRHSLAVIQSFSVLYVLCVICY